MPAIRRKWKSVKDARFLRISCGNSQYENSVSSYLQDASTQNMGHPDPREVPTGKHQFGLTLKIEIFPDYHGDV
jgi:hypothetical protein